MLCVLIMSRIGKLPISIPQGVKVRQEGNIVHIEGPKGALQQAISPDITLHIEDHVLRLERPTEQKRHKAQHGLYRALLQNMVTGVSEGYTQSLELIGVGYKATHQGQILELSLGHSHNIFMEIPKEVTLNTETVKGKGSGNPTVILQSIDKQLLGQVAAKVRSLRKVEPYKGKGIRYLGEEVRRKAGKTAAKKQ